MSLSLICCSHSPLMLTGIEATDPGAQQGFFDAMHAAGQWLAERHPELLVVLGPDHFTGFFYDLMPAFCVGVEAAGGIDWGIEPGPLSVPRDLAVACHRALSANGFDPAISYRLRVDHGTTIPLYQLAGRLDAYPVLPVVVNCAASSRPSLARVRAFGHALGEFLTSLDRRIVIIGSGGLSHDPPTPALDPDSPEVVARLVDRHHATKAEYDRRQARVLDAARALVAGGGPCIPPSEAWDRRFLEDLASGELARFDEGYDDETMDREAGFGGHEVRTWVAGAAAMRAAGGYALTVDYYRIVPEWITGMAVARGETRAPPESPARPSPA